MNQQKDLLQKDINKAINFNNGTGIIAAATGSGKTKCAIDYIKQLKPRNSLWVVPTEKLRDVTIPDEFVKWKAKTIFNKSVTTICYASIAKIKNQYFDLVVLDEGHKITELNSQFFDNNQIDKILMLTATVPHEIEKKEILKSLGLKVIYKLKVDDAVSIGVVSPYRIVIVQGYLDPVSRNVPAGNAAKRFLVTEEAQYRYLTERINKISSLGRDVPKYMYFQRMRFIYNLKSKINTVKRILNKIPNDKRVLIFCGSINAAEELCDYTFHSKTDDTDYVRFNNKEINRLAVVNALNEGHNMTDVDVAIMAQVNSNARNYIQRQGRAIRWRPGHKAAVYIISTLNTVDEKWVRKSIQELDQTNIKYIYSSDVSR